MQKNHILFLIVGIGVVVLVGYFVTKHKGTDISPHAPPDTRDTTACTQEAKICPDGSTVARVAPSCEFAACPSVTTTIPPAKSAEMLCAEEGGVWQKVGVLGKYQCIHTYSDGGKMCTSSSQCQGGCIATTGNGTAGSCKRDDNPFGCYQFIEDKNAGKPVLCRD